MKKYFWIPMTAGALLVSGCGGQDQTASNSSPAQNTHAAAVSAHTVSTPSNASAPKNTPASVQANLVLPSDAKEVVRLFMDSMRQANGPQLAALLSTAAREEIKRKELEISPLGSPAATFEIGEAALQGDGMLVSSVWIEPEQGGEPSTELEVVWELRQEPNGWRICGMAVAPKGAEEGDVQVVNFEQLEGDSPEADPQAEAARVASLPNASLPQQPATQPNGLPPALPNPATSPNALPPGALPPSNLPPSNLPPASFAPANLPPASLPPSGATLPPADNQPNTFRR